MGDVDCGATGETESLTTRSTIRQNTITITLGSIVKKTSATGWTGKVVKEEQFGYVDVLWAWDAAPTSVLVSDLRLVEEKRQASWAKAFAEWESRPKKGKVNATKGVSSKSRKTKA